MGLFGRDMPVFRVMPGDKRLFARQNSLLCRVGADLGKKTVLSASVIACPTRQGTPAAITLGGMSFVTTLPEPMMETSPMVTPGFRWQPVPIQTRLAIRTCQGKQPPAALSAAWTEWLGV